MPSAWITHVKKYAAENNIPYKEALSKASPSYKKGSGETHTMPDGTEMKGKTHGSGHCQEGGFFFITMAAIAAAASAAAASAAATATAIAATTIVGTVTVGSAASAIATVAAPIIIEKMLGDGLSKKEQVKVVQKQLLDVVGKSKITLKDFSGEAKQKLKEGYEKLKKNPSKEGVIALGKEIAPHVRELMKAKIEKNLNKTKIMTGAGFNLAGAGAKKFDSAFVKEFAKKLE